jgi:small-conductance mechanosensitive channel
MGKAVDGLGESLLAPLATENATQRMTMDRVAVLLSGVCLLHCMAIPLAILVLPSMSSLLLGSETLVHWLLLGLAVPISVLALWVGYTRYANLRSVLLGTSGLLLMFVAVSHFFGRAPEVPLTLAGVALVAWAHWLNIRRARKHAAES